jgi:hypothetical protein
MNSVSDATFEWIDGFAEAHAAIIPLLRAELVQDFMTEIEHTFRGIARAELARVVGSRDELSAHEYVARVMSVYDGAKLRLNRHPSGLQPGLSYSFTSFLSSGLRRAAIDLVL